MKSKSRLGRLLAGCFAFVGLGFLLTGCTLSAADVKLHTKEEMQKLLEERYGDAEFVSETEDKEKHVKTFTFRDAKYGFTYETTSRPNSVGLDGATFYYDGASVTYKYEEPFLKYFLEQEKGSFAARGIELCETLSHPSNESYPAASKFSLKDKRLLSSEDRYESDAGFVFERLHAYKTIPETSNYKLSVYNNERYEYFGSMEEGGFRTALQERIEYFMHQAEILGGIQGVEFLRVEEKKISEIPELADQIFYDRGLIKVKVYYYSYEGNEYFIIDKWVAQTGDNGGGIFQYYQSYKHYDVAE